MDNKKIIEQLTSYFLNDMVNNGASSAAIMIYEKNNIKFYKSTHYKWQELNNIINYSKILYLP